MSRAYEEALERITTESVDITTPTKTLEALGHLRDIAREALEAEVDADALNESAVAACASLGEGDPAVALVYANLAVAGEIRETREADVAEAIKRATAPLEEQLERAKESDTYIRGRLEELTRTDSRLQAGLDQIASLEPPERLVGEHPGVRTQRLEEFIAQIQSFARDT